MSMTGMIISLAAAALTAGGLSFALPAGRTTDVPDLYCAQVDRGERTWIVCAEDLLDDDEIRALIDRGERVRSKHLGAPKGDKP